MIQKLRKNCKKHYIAYKLATNSADVEVYRNHNDKIDRRQWAHDDDANSYPYDQIWLGTDIDDAKRIASTKPLWEKRQKSIYVEIVNEKITTPKDKITNNDAREIIHILDTALHRIMEVTEYHGHQIGTKGFMK